MGSTIDDAAYEMHLEKQWREERKMVSEALGKIANSSGISELQRNLDELKHIYSSEVSVDDKNVDSLISQLDFSLPKLREYLDYKDKKSGRLQMLYFLLGLILPFIIQHMIQFFTA